MINVEKVIELLNEKGQMTFKEVWKVFEKNYLSDFSEEMDKNVLKADLLLSMSKDENIILISKNKQKKWDLRKKYSLDQVRKISTEILDEELDKIENLMD
ncbi:MAG: hypothetical protein HPAVJP_5930 [Candidatus Hepatoplasma vulgare]|nr:MAG: hypothetical protein HPAVJP_5930 [Candidatus Hepatoplasma sp.]